jgi:hypothetical protein
MDIERSESRVLHDLLEVHRYLSGMVVELHDLDMICSNFLELLTNPQAHSESTERIILY